MGSVSGDYEYKYWYWYWYLLGIDIGIGKNIGGNLWEVCQVIIGSIR